MANPLFETFGKGSNPVQPDMQSMMRQLRENPAQMIKNAGYNVPDELVNNPQAAVMHLIQTGQISSPLMQKIRPMLGMLTGR